MPLSIFNQTEKIRSRWIIFGIILIQSAVFFPMAYLRLIDGDEGYYILSSKLVWQGRMLYQGFFYPQMPLLPFIYGLWMKLFSVSWLAARSLSALFATGIGCFLYWNVTQVTGKRLAGFAAVIVYTFSIMIFGWYVVVKTYALTGFLLFSAYSLLSYASSVKAKNTKSIYLLTGFLLGLSVDTRLYILFVIPVFFIELYRTSDEPEKRLVDALWMLVGICIGLLPNLYFILHSPEQFWFNNVVYHSLRSNEGLIGGLKQKVQLALSLFGFESEEGYMSIQFTLLATMNVLYVIGSLILKKRLSLSFFITCILFLTLLLPTPTFSQYFSAVIPFMIVNAVLGGAYCFSILSEYHSTTMKRGLILLFATSATGYILISPFDMYRYTIDGQNVQGVYFTENAKNWKLSTMQSIASEINSISSPDEAIISFWPGYVLESHCSIFPAMENHFGILIASKLQPSELKKFKIISHEEIQKQIIAHTTRIVILGNYTPVELKPLYRELLLRCGYSITKTIGDAEVFCFAGANQ